MWARNSPFIAQKRQCRGTGRLCCRAGDSAKPMPRALVSPGADESAVSDFSGGSSRWKTLSLEPLCIGSWSVSSITLGMRRSVWMCLNFRGCLTGRKLVNLVCARKAIIKEYIQLMEACGLNLCFIDAIDLAHARVQRRWMRIPRLGCSICGRVWHARIGKKRANAASFREDGGYGRVL